MRLARGCRPLVACRDMMPPDRCTVRPGRPPMANTPYPPAPPPPRRHRGRRLVLYVLAAFGLILVLAIAGSVVAVIGSSDSTDATGPTVRASVPARTASSPPAD